jgi:photosystem II stability/assembly factor-like uncharacterized protein
MKFKILIISCFFSHFSLIAQTYWVPQTSNISKQLWSVKAVDSSVVWACGDSGIVLRTTDGGDNWSLTTAPNDNLNCYSIEAINADTAWVVSTNNLGGNTALYKTINGGISWQIKQSSNLPSSFYNAVKFYDKNNGLLQGDPENGYFTIYITDNGGETWIRIDSTKIPASDGSEEYGITNNLAVSGNKAWFGTQNNFGKNGRVFYSNDKGKSWSVIAPVDYDIISTIAFSTELIGIIVYDNNNVAYTRDGGLTWTTTSSPLYGSGSSFATSSSFILVGLTSSYVSTDGGVTWAERETNITSSYLEAVSFANPSDGWAVGEKGVILKWNGGSLPDVPLSSIDNLSNTVPRFELEQNYPNPFNPTTTIEYSIQERSNVIVKVFDLLGREITTLVNEEKIPGNYKVEFDAINLPSGVYFYRLETEKFYEIKKLVLLR